MTRVLLTGATGFIGAHVAQALLSRDYDVRALVRNGDSLAADHGFSTVVTGDIRDEEAVAAAVAGCDAVVHTAAAYSLSSGRASEVFATNVQGTANVLRAAARAGVQRVVYTSTVGTIGFRTDRLSDEDDLAGASEMAGPYKRSKYEAERVARRVAAGGLPLVIVKPTFPVGAMDRKPTPSGQTIVDFLRGAMPAVVDTGLNVVDVADVAEGHVLALERGTPGQDYILGNTEGNVTLSQLLHRLAEIAGLKAPRLRLPHFVASIAGTLDTFVEGALLRREPRIPMAGVRMARTRMWVDPSKAVRDLGLPQRPIDAALTSAVDWFVKNGYAPTPRSRTGSPAGTP